MKPNNRGENTTQLYGNQFDFVADCFPSLLRNAINESKYIVVLLFVFHASFFGATEVQEVGRHWQLDIKHVAVLSLDDEWRYILGFTCLNSGHIELFYTSTRSDAVIIIELFVRRLQAGTLFPRLSADAKNSLILASDNAAEFLGKDMEIMALKYSIFRTTSAPYKHTDMFAIDLAFAFAWILTTLSISCSDT